MLTQSNCYCNCLLGLSLAKREKLMYTHNNKLNGKLVVLPTKARENFRLGISNGYFLEEKICKLYIDLSLTFYEIQKNAPIWLFTSVVLSMLMSSSIWRVLMVFMSSLLMQMENLPPHTSIKEWRSRQTSKINIP